MRHHALVRTLLGTVLLHVAPVANATQPEPERLRRHVEYLAHDDREGRGVGTRGLEEAAAYIAARFKKVGLEPGASDGSWYQVFEATTGLELVGENTLTLGDTALELDVDWRPYAFSDVGTIAAPLVFVGYGIKAPEYDWDDYADVEVTGKVVVALALEPGQADSTSAFDGNSLTVHSGLYPKAIYARDNGAAGLILVVGPHSDLEDKLKGLKADAVHSSARILCAQVRSEALQRALPNLDLGALQQEIESSGQSASRPLDAQVEWRVELEKERTPLRNVIGVLPGRDPHRAVVIGAHYDHLGMGGSSSLAPDANEPHNGADDNASGTAALLEIARCFSAREEKPEQALVFAAFSGEEIGLAGSEHYVDDPAFPLQFTSAMLNMDMVGRLRNRRLNVLGAASAEEFRDILESENAAGPQFELKARGDGYGPSDQMAFFKKSVPVLHFFTGAHSDYHKPSDDAELLNYEGLADIAAFVARVAEAVSVRELTYVGASAPAGDTGVGGGFRSALGTIPDYGQPEDLEGVLLSDVRAGSAAEKGGIRGGDVIVRIGDMEIHNIYDFVHVLKTRDPGEKLEVVVLREEERVTLQVTLDAPKR
jgi:hypothetical protein